MMPNIMPKAQCVLPEQTKDHNECLKASCALSIIFILGLSLMANLIVNGMALNGDLNISNTALSAFNITVYSLTIVAAVAILKVIDEPKTTLAKTIAFYVAAVFFAVVIVGALGLSGHIKSVAHIAWSGIGSWGALSLLGLGFFAYGTYGLCKGEK